jgi:hypothetical protein
MCIIVKPLQLIKVESGKLKLVLFFLYIYILKIYYILTESIKFFKLIFT